MLRWPQSMEIKGFFGKKRCMFRTCPARPGSRGTMPPRGRHRGRRKGSRATGLLRKGLCLRTGAAGYAAEGRSPQVVAMKGAPGAEQRGKKEYRGFSEPGARRNLRRGKREGASPGGASAEKRRRNIPRREQHARRNNKARIFLRRRGLFCSLRGRGRP